MRENLLIEHTHHGRVTHLVLNSPENLNAMDLQMAGLFREATARLRTDAACRAVVIRANGRSFSAGGDLKMLRAKASLTVERNRREMMEFYRSFLALRGLHVPLVCALHGHVVGAGFCFSAACDIRLADVTVLMSAPFTRLALHPGMGGSYFLPRAFGAEVARDLMLTGRRMGAEEALRLGFLSQVVEKGELMAGLEQTLGKLLKSAPEATSALLRSEREGEEPALRAALEREAFEQALCYSRKEFLQGLEAVSEKRDPPWG